MQITKEDVFSKLKSCIWPGMTLLLFFCFVQKITDLLLGFTEKWLTNCNEVAGGVAIIVLAIIAAIHLCLKGRNIRFSFSHVAWTIVLTVVYLYYRCGVYFDFWGFTLKDKEIAFADFIVAPIIVAFIIQIVLCFEKVMDNDDNCMLDQDEPIVEDKEDVLGYGNIINSLLADLRLLNLSKGSFSVGVAGEWGIGKSSFFNLFKNKLKDDRDSIVVEYNPRSSAKLEDIQKDFFNTFADALSSYHSGISRDMSRYQDALKLPEDNFVLRLLRLLPSLTMSRGKSVINEVIKSINKRIYVFVDDLDRLTAKEILEVLKVIDKNGDFRQTIFITAYDKEYVNNVLKNYLKHSKKDAFTDKYFNYELYLPVQSREVLSDYVKQTLRDKLKSDENDAISVEQMQVEWDTIAQTIVPYLHTLRHAKRFMNIFLSRYGRVRNDVDFSDFIRVTLLRYFDINTYHALVEGKLIKGGGLMSYTTEKCLYQADDMKEQLKCCSQWGESLTVLTELFEKAGDNDFELTTKYKRLRSKDAFACYFYDYEANGVYYKDLMQLYDATTEEDAINCLHTLLNYDKEKNTFSQERYVAVENFLRIRPVKELRNANNVTRLFVLLCYLNQFTGRSINKEASIAYLMGKDAEKEMNNICNGKYKETINEAIKYTIEVQPLSIAYLLLYYNEEMLKPEQNLTKYLFTQGEIRGFAEWCQKKYFQQLKTINLQNVENVLSVSRVKRKVHGEVLISDNAKDVFVRFISSHADDFVKSILRISKTKNERTKLVISVLGMFVPSEFFPYMKEDFSSWVRKEVRNSSTSYLLNIVLAEQDRQLQIELTTEDQNMEPDDYERIFNIVKTEEEKKEEVKILDAINQNVAVSIELLSSQTGLSTEATKDAVGRLVDKGKLGGKKANITDTIPPFEVGDFVRIKDSLLNKYIDENTRLNYRWNLFEIWAINKDAVKLSNIEMEVPVSDVEAIPIDGDHDEKIIYDPVLLPTSGKIAGGIDYSYYMKTFERSFDEKGRRYCDLVIKNDFHFVHEVQRWLRNQGDFGLKINNFEL